MKISLKSIWLQIITSKSKLTGLVLLVGVLIFMFFYTLQNFKAALEKKKNFEYNASSDTLYIKKINVFMADPGLVTLSKELSYRQAFLKLVPSDSISLFINITDSIAGLSYNGVVLHSAKISDYKVDRLLKSLSGQAYLKIFSYPQLITANNASIAKLPVIVKKAPSTPEEAAQSVYLPDTLKSESAHISLKTENGIEIRLHQSENRGRANRKAANRFRMYNNLVNAGKNISKLFTKGRPEYFPRIDVELPGKDITVLYRALPDSGKVIVKF